MSLCPEIYSGYDFVSFCPKLDKPIQNFFIDALLRRVA